MPQTVFSLECRKAFCIRVMDVVRLILRRVCVVDSRFFEMGKTWEKFLGVWTDKSNFYSAVGSYISKQSDFD
jgi:hypothetical protein